jgi:osmoprotectant transport system permease protein
VQWDWVHRHRADILRATGEHLQIVIVSVAVAFVIALPLAIAIRRRPVAAAVATGVVTVLYTVPSLALFAILVSIIGLGRLPAVVALVSYSVGILLRSMLTGFGQLPRPVLDAARGIGYSEAQLLRRVELPLSVPAIFSGLRVAMVETVAIATIAVFVAGGGLGVLIFSDGISRSLFVTPIVVGATLAVGLALCLDGLLLVAERLLAPWQRSARETT